MPCNKQLDAFEHSLKGDPNAPLYLRMSSIGQIAALFSFLAVLIGSCVTIYHYIKKALNKLFAEQLKAIDKRMDDLDKRIDAVDNNSCKNYLVTFLSDVEKDERIDEIEKERFYEQYEHYTKQGGNSYIKHKVEKLKSEGKL